MSDRYKSVFDNNRQWVESRKKEDPGFFERLSAEQTPDFLFIGCADSRVPANEITGLEPGDLFVHRNIANLVVNTDTNCQAVIEFAVSHLQVKHIVVCGHYGCGGVRAAMEPKDLGILNGWLREIRDVYRLHSDELNTITDEKLRYERLVELNVYEQCINVTKTAAVQKQYIRQGFPTVHGWVYDLSEGLLKDLDFRFDETLADIQEIYRLDVDS